MDFYKIQNNTNNSIIINEIFIGPKLEVILSKDVVLLIDIKYFETGILNNLGLISIDKDNFIIDTKNNQQEMNEQNSVLIRERQFEQSVVKKLNKGVEAYRKVIEDKIDYEDLTEELKFLFNQLDENNSEVWKDPVFTKELLPLEGNKNGDIRITLDDNVFWRWRAEGVEQWEPINLSSGETEIPIPNLKSRFVLGEFFADKGQQTFKASYPYKMENNSLQVQLNGILMLKNDDYIEVDEYTIEFLYPLEENDYIVMSVLSIGQDPFIIIETTEIKENKIRIVKFQHAFNPENIEALQVFLNGISVNVGKEYDFIVNDSSSLKFNYDLEIGDKVTIRFASSSTSDNIEQQFAQIQKIYQTLSKQVKILKDKIEKDI